MILIKLEINTLTEQGKLPKEERSSLYPPLNKLDIMVTWSILKCQLKKRYNTYVCANFCDWKGELWVSIGCLVVAGDEESKGLAKLTHAHDHAGSRSHHRHPTFTRTYDLQRSICIWCIQYRRQAGATWTIGLGISFISRPPPKRRSSPDALVSNPFTTGPVSLFNFWWWSRLC
jgi:hypothetical protein